MNSSAQEKQLNETEYEYYVYLAGCVFLRRQREMLTVIMINISRARCQKQIGDRPLRTLLLTTIQRANELNIHKKHR